MPTPRGIAFAKQRLSEASSLEALREVWGNLGRDYQRSPEVQKHKDKLKAKWDVGRA